LKKISKIRSGEAGRKGVERERNSRPALAFRASRAGSLKMAEIGRFLFGFWPWSFFA